MVCSSAKSRSMSESEDEKTHGPSRLIDQPPGGSVKIVSWNVNGIRAVVRKQVFHAFVETYDPDVICLQETKAHPGQVTLELPGHPYQYWNGADQRGYAGTAILSKTAPLMVHYGMGVDHHDREGRVITAEFATYFVVSVYVPNA